MAVKCSKCEKKLPEGAYCKGFSCPLNPSSLESTAPTTGSAPTALHCACGNIAETRDAHVDALRCKSCWSRFAAPASPEANVPVADAREALTDAVVEAWLDRVGNDRGQGLHPIYTSGVREGYRLARSTLTDFYALLAASTDGDKS